MILLVIVLAQQQHASSFITGVVLGVGGAGTVLGSVLGGLLCWEPCCTGGSNDV